MIVEKHRVRLNSAKYGDIYPYELAGTDRFDPNNPPHHYGRIDRITLVLIFSDKSIKEYPMKIPNGCKPVFKMVRRKIGNAAALTVGYKIGYRYQGLRFINQINTETGQITEIVDKVA